MGEDQDVAVHAPVRRGRPLVSPVGGVSAEIGGCEVHGDDVLEVEQVGVLPGGHHRPGRVDENPAVAVTPGEDHKDAAEP
ncbi:MULTISPECIES: hypothetical protein [unclassified Pseudonocardia]|uniref:hypothetical protein n=1 Tax=unclassified Pseudonocardia TaxID=2619320 RepID=UPI001ACC0B89|nr:MULTISPECIES: hypothetical protein [unclassified Pseudonocardia]MBN9097959.1 hypothetical protein [Pseudonocardia sp.]